MRLAPLSPELLLVLPLVGLKSIVIGAGSIVVIASAIVVLALIVARFSYLLISKSKVAPVIEIGRFKIDFRSLGSDARDGHDDSDERPVP